MTGKVLVISAPECGLRKAAAARDIRRGCIWLCRVCGMRSGLTLIKPKCPCRDIVIPAPAVAP